MKSRIRQSLWGYRWHMIVVTIFAKVDHDGLTFWATFLQCQWTFHLRLIQGQNAFFLAPISPLLLYRLILSSPSPVLTVSSCANRGLCASELKPIKSSPFPNLASSISNSNRSVSSQFLILVIRWSVSSIKSGLLGFASQLCSVLPAFSSSMA